MKNIYFLLVCLFMVFGAVNAQSPNKYAFSTPVEPDKPVFFNQTPLYQEGSKGVMAKLYPGEDVILCLYRINELVQAYDQLDSLKSFYADHQSLELWVNTRERLFWDRQTDISPWVITIASTHSTKKAEDLSRRFPRPQAMLGEEIYTQLIFCLGYLMVDHTDPLVINSYLIPKFKIVEEVLALDVPPRLKAWILANDIYNSCVIGINGFPIVALQ